MGGQPKVVVGKALREQWLGSPRLAKAVPEPLVKEVMRQSQCPLVLEFM